MVAAERVVTYVNIRARPTTASDIVGRLYPGKTAPLVSEGGLWFAIELSGGETGYVSRNWTSKVSMPAATARREVKVQTATKPYPTPAPAPVKPQRDRGVLNRASELLSQGRDDEAYRLLAAVETDWAGDTGFDYLYGIAALDSGSAGDAVFALDRVVKTLPGFVGARMELARALYATGDRDRARAEFGALLDAGPPDDVRAVIDGYLDAIDRPAAAAGRPAKRLYAAAAAGYDSNANGASDTSNFMGFVLDPRNVERDTTFIEAQLGGAGNRPLSPNVAMQWQGIASHRHNPDADFVDRSVVATNAAFVFNRGAADWLVGAGAYWTTLDDGSNEYGTALDLGWHRNLQNDNALELKLRAGPVRFDSSQNVRDIDRVIYSLTLSQPLQGGGGELRWTAIGGRDRAHDISSPYSNSRIGGRVGARWKLANNDLDINVGYLSIPYNGNRTFFGIDRDDKQFVASLALTVRDRPLRGWSFVPRLRYVKNDSNVSLFDYDRIEAGFQLEVARQ